jgi:bifunctional non-homologous end joining protein LigD
MSIENTTLYYRQGNSDKIYQAAVSEQDGGYVVNFAFGRRGSTLQTGTKTFTPVPFDQAKKIYDKLVREKTAKGYTPGANGTPYSGTENAQRATGILPQLLNPIDEAQVERLLADPTHWMQQKHDGKRVIIQVGEKIVGVNRKGLTIALPQSITESAAAIRSPCILDGEAVGDRYFAFDLISVNGVDQRSRQYSKRHEALFKLIDEGVGSIEWVETYCREANKRDAFERLVRERAEGVVFKSVDAQYMPGRPASGGPQLKFKFHATVSLIVASVNKGKRSVELALLDGRKRIAVGNVTIPPNAAVPVAGAIIEARYLYAYKGGSLYQPVFIGVRDDLDASACTLTQLKFKPEEDDDAGV